MNFMDGNTLKLTGLSDGENKAKHDCLVIASHRASKI